MPKIARTTLLASGLGWPEGPTRLPDGRIAFVESYRSQVSVWDGSHVSRLAYVGGGPNAALATPHGYLYVTQNGGKIGPWRAVDQRPSSIQRVNPDGSVDIVVTTIEGRPLLAPNDLAFGPNGWLYFTDPGGAYDPVGKTNRGFIYALRPNGDPVLLQALPPTYPNGIVVDHDGSVVWVESYTRAVKRMLADGDVVELCVLPAPAIPDGLKIASNGDLYITGVDSGTIEIVRGDGTHIGQIRLGKVPTNCLFEGSALYVTDGGEPGLTTEPPMQGNLWRVDLEDAAGMPLHNPINITY